MMEYLVFGAQKLCALRDKIFCSSDYIIDKDYSDNPDAFDRDSTAVSLTEHALMLPLFITTVPSQKPISPSKSAFFFINKTFYNDLRHPDSTDLSR